MFKWREWERRKSQAWLPGSSFDNSVAGSGILWERENKGRMGILKGVNKFKALSSSSLSVFIYWYVYQSLMIKDLRARLGVGGGVKYSNAEKVWNFQALKIKQSFPGDVSGKEPACQCRRTKRLGFHPWVRKIPWRRAWQPSPSILAWRIPWTEESGRLQSIGSQRVRHD